MGSDIIHISEVHKSLGGKNILQNLSFKIKANKFYSLIGESGSGKTTCLRLINGLIRPDSGEIYIDGKAINYQQVVKLRRQMGYVVQGSGLFPHLNTLENISIIAKREGWKKQDILVQAHRILETVNLDPDEFLYKYPKQMSGGQQQRVSIARSLFLSPKIMLMDEAFGALDPNTRTEIQDFFLELREKYPLTVILVTHDVAEALKMSDEIIVLNSGRVEQMGSPSDLVKTPKSRYVSNYINIINRQSMLFQKLYGNNN